MREKIQHLITARALVDSAMTELMSANESEDREFNADMNKCWDALFDVHRGLNKAENEQMEREELADAKGN